MQPSVSGTHTQATARTAHGHAAVLAQHALHAAHSLVAGDRPPADASPDLYEEYRRTQEIVDERRQGLIQVLAWVFLGLLGTGLLAILLVARGNPTHTTPLVTFAIFTLGIGGALGALGLVRHKRTLPAANLLVYGFWLAASLSLLADNGLNGPVTEPSLRFSAFLCLAVLWAGLLIGPRSAFATAILSSAIVGLALALPGDLGQIFTQATFVLTTYYTIAFVTWFFSAAVQRQLTARATQLAASNARIQAEARLREESSVTVETLAVQVAEAAEEQLSVLNEEAVALGNVSATMDELGKAAEQIATLAATAAQAAGTAQAETVHGQQVIEHALAALKQLDGSVQEITRRMRTLEERIAQTEAVTEQIGEIADDLQLLALNAQIEAAGAGAAGARFRVVATEVTRLAQDARQSAAHTQRLLSEVRSTGAWVVQATEAGSSIAHDGEEVAAAAAAANTQIGSLVEQASEQMQAIGSSTNQQRSAAQQVQQILHDLASAAQQSQHASEETTLAAGELRTLARHLQDSMVGPVAA